MTPSIRRLAAAAVATVALSGAASAAAPNTVPTPGVAAAKALPSTCKGCYAVVNADGTLARGNGVLQTSRTSTGQYVVRFDGKITKCAFVATLGLASFSGAESPGFVTVAGAAGTTNGVYLNTQNASPANEDRAFHLDVKCP